MGLNKRMHQKTETLLFFTSGALGRAGSVLSLILPSPFPPFFSPVSTVSWNGPVLELRR